MGGANSLRGFQEFSYYGDYRLSMNIEPRYQFNEGLMGVVFLDMGYIADSLYSIDFSSGSEFMENFHYGYGGGIRILNSLLTLRFDLAYGDDLILHFNVSQMF